MFVHYLITTVAWAALMLAAMAELVRAADKGWTRELSLTYGALLLVTVVFFICELQYQTFLMAVFSACAAAVTLGYLLAERVLFSFWDRQDSREQTKTES